MKKFDLRLLVILALALTARWFNHHDIIVSLQGDAQSYIKAANDFLNFGYFGPTTYRPPLYPFVLAAAAKLLQMPTDWQQVHSLINTVCDLGSLLLLYRIGRRYFGNALYIGLSFAAVSPLWYAHQQSAITECLSVVLFLAFVDYWTSAERSIVDKQRIWFEVGAGVAIGLLALTRGSFLAFPFLVVGGELAYRYWKNGLIAVRAQLKYAMIFLVAALALPTLWGVRNLRYSGHFVMSQDSSTADLMLWSSYYLPTLDWRILEHQQKLAESPYAEVVFGLATPEEVAEALPKMRAEALAFMREHPVQFVLDFFRKTVRLWVTGWWSPYPYIKVPPYLGINYIAGFCVPVLLWGGWGWLRRARRSHKKPGETRLLLAMLISAIFVTSIALPFCVDSRYSLPMIVLLSLWMGTGFGVENEDAQLG